MPEGCELLVFDSYDDELEECTGNVLNWTPSTVATAGSAAAKGGYNPSEALDDGCLMLCCPKNDLGGPGFVGPVKADDHLSNAVINSVLQGTQGLFCNTLIAHSWVCTHYEDSQCLISRCIFCTCHSAVGPTK